MTRFDFDFSVDGIKISGDHRQRSVKYDTPPYALYNYYGYRFGGTISEV